MKKRERAEKGMEIEGDRRNVCSTAEGEYACMFPESSVEKSQTRFAEEKNRSLLNRAVT